MARRPFAGELTHASRIPTCTEALPRFNITYLQGGVEFDGLGVSAIILHKGRRGKGSQEG